MAQKPFCMVRAQEMIPKLGLCKRYSQASGVSFVSQSRQSFTDTLTALAVSPSLTTRLLRPNEPAKFQSLVADRYIPQFIAFFVQVAQEHWQGALAIADLGESLRVIAICQPTPTQAHLFLICTGTTGSFRATLADKVTVGSAHGWSGASVKEPLGAGSTDACVLLAAVAGVSVSTSDTWTAQGGGCTRDR